MKYAIIAAAFALAGCAAPGSYHPPNSHAQQNFMNALSGAAMIEQSRRPMYQPMPIQPMTHCTSRWIAGTLHTSC